MTQTLAAVDDGRAPTCGAPTLRTRSRGRAAPVVLDGLTDDVLVGLTLSGDRGAHEALLRRHQKRIHRLALRMLEDPCDAEDATQEVMARLPVSMRSFQGTSSFTTWLHRVVANHCLRQIHRRRRFDPARYENATSVSGADVLVLSRQRSAAVLGAVAALGPALQAVLRLCEFDGLTYSEAAAVLDVPESTVRGRLARARRALLPSLRAWR
ncbi:RNA polymerase sigma-70 factor (ECF subfamily) [Pseudonocardia sediminis]|uniref:RNA polymerase sigma-70 factor (ECF subfamily) n=1 Tax=Pseudonocardia sediminis TaxID=1397368 RepID=A0A4Q7V0J9_PSEST|nr:RNA polymerase sigma factor [Pseudonocardia sediminis]RZT86938.1 RNA polymerase sigma-70 factor (ECF subfamily) [Pseudonocardia sediminis]